MSAKSVMNSPPDHLHPLYELHPSDQFYLTTDPVRDILTSACLDFLMGAWCSG